VVLCIKTRQRFGITLATAIQKLRLGTRGSLLAQAQSHMIAAELERVHPGLAVELIIVRTTGDAVTDRPLHELGGKGLFTKELEQQLLSKTIDFAVHSFKDVPMTMPLVDQSNLVIAATPKREDPRDLFVSESASEITGLPIGAKIGTGSLRRRSQLLALRPDLQVEPIRGNVDTRLKKLRAGEYQAVVLALAGVKRAALFDASLMFPIEPGEMIPAPAQGALALQCRADDVDTRTFLAALDDAETHRCVTAERELVRLLNGDCTSPIAALATASHGRLAMRSAVGAHGGSPPVLRAEAEDAVGNSLGLAQRIFDILQQRGVNHLLHA
jgi:hydroxymethylbilane synthase